MPFRGTFVGSVRNRADLISSGTGQPNIDFDLVDDTGGTFACSVVGPHARYTRIKDNEKVVVYHAEADRKPSQMHL